MEENGGYPSIKTSHKLKEGCSGNWKYLVTTGVDVFARVSSGSLNVAGIFHKVFSKYKKEEDIKERQLMPSVGYAMTKSC